MRRTVLLTLLLAAVALGAPAAALAQRVAGKGTIQATATILFPPLTTDGVRPIQFGTVTPGANRTIFPNQPGAGELRISGVRNRRTIIVTLTLPSVLRNAGGRTMPLSFDGEFAANCEITAAGVCDQVTYVAWNPVTNPTFTDTPDRARKGRPRYDLDGFSIYVGGIAQPAPNQAPGVYTANVLVSIVAN